MQIDASQGSLPLSLLYGLGNAWVIGIELSPALLRRESHHRRLMRNIASIGNTPHDTLSIPIRLNVVTRDEIEQLAQRLVIIDEVLQYLPFVDLLHT